MARAPRPPRIHACNVLADAGGRSRLWSFAGSEARPAPVVEQAADAPLPAQTVGRGWAQLFRHRVNVAWLIEQPVFVQLVLLPTDDPNEVPAMLELQIEKLSPLPVGQVVWSYEVLPQHPPGSMAVIVLVAERGAIESTLHALEGRGCAADRVESPLLQLVAGTRFDEDGVWVFVRDRAGRRECLVGWVNQGALRSLTMLHLASDDRWLDHFEGELNRLVWVGEMEGWLPEDRTVHLVAEPAIQDAWTQPLRDRLGVAVKPRSRPSDAEIAGAVARRIVAGESRANLMPPEFAVRYQQQFTDRLWMGGLGTLFGVYLIAVLVYLGAVEVMRYRQGRLADEFAQVNTAYTNTLRVKAQMQVMQETIDLRFASLDCWMATVEAMPDGLVLESFQFTGGQGLAIRGYAQADQEGRVTEFWQALRRKVVGKTNLFSEVQLKPTTVRNAATGREILWGFDCRLQRVEL